MYKIGVISDTHNLLRESVMDVLRSCNVILHAGDIGSPQILAQLKSAAPLYAVRGNTDKEWASALPKTLFIKLSGVRIFMIHNKKQIREDIRDQDIIIYGHSHKYEDIQKNGQIWLNPGSCGAKRFTLPVTMAVIHVSEHSSQQPPHSGMNAAFQIERIDLDMAAAAGSETFSRADMKKIILCVIKETDKGKPVSSIAKSCHISGELAEQICRLYLTHPGVSADGILSKMGL